MFNEYFSKLCNSRLSIFFLKNSDSYNILSYEIFLWQKRSVYYTNEELTNQRFSKRHQYLPTQKVKEIGGCRGIADDPIYLKKLSSHDLLDSFTGGGTGFCSGHMSTFVVAQLKESLQSGRRMFRPLGLHAMR